MVRRRAFHPRIRRWAKGTLLIFLLGSFGPLWAAEKKRREVEGIPPPKVSVVVFALTKEEEAQNAPNELLSVIPDMLVHYLNLTGRFDATLFYARSPIVEQALRTQQIKEEDLVSAAPDVSRAKVARVLGAQGYLAGSISAFSQDPQQNKVEIGLSLELMDLATNRPQLIGVSGSTTGPQGTPIGTVALEAARIASARAAASAAGLPQDAFLGVPSEGKKPVQKKRHGFRQWWIIPVVGLAIGLAVALSGGNGGGKVSNGGGTPPAPPF